MCSEWHCSSDAQRAVSEIQDILDIQFQHRYILTRGCSLAGIPSGGVGCPSIELAAQYDGQHILFLSSIPSWMSFPIWVLTRSALHTGATPARASATVVHRRCALGMEWLNPNLFSSSSENPRHHARYVRILLISFCTGFFEDSWRLGGGLQLVLGCLEFFFRAHVPEKSIKDVPCTKLMDDYVHPGRP
jgi:hypothetical protein